MPGNLVILTALGYLIKPLLSNLVAWLFNIEPFPGKWLFNKTIKTNLVVGLFNIKSFSQEILL